MQSSFEAWLKHARKTRDLTQHELARRVGCSESTLRKIEAGRLRPSRQIAERIAVCLEIPLSERSAFVGAARSSGIPHGSQPGPLPSRAAPPAGDAPASIGFPTPLSPLIGRADENAAAISALLHVEVRLLTLIGPPGVGKTRLALQVAAEVQGYFGDGVAFIPLAAVSNADVMLTTIAQALGVRETHKRSTLDALAGFLRDKQLLLVLDNLEQLATVCAPLAALLSAAPRVKLLCTSRIVLHLPGEHCSTLRPLALPSGETADLAEITASPAVALFAARVREHQPGFLLTPTSAERAVQLCRRLDGLPLALELAAARLRLFTLGELLDQFEQLGSAGTLRLLRSGPYDQAQQSTLWETIATSYALLSTPARSVFTALASFPGGCTLDAALAVCAIPTIDSTELLGAIAELVDASLLQRSVTRADETRLVMLETIRAFAHTTTATQDAARTLALRHLAYYRALAKRIETAVLGPEQRRWLEQIVAEQPNIRAALATSLTMADYDTRLEALHIAAALWWGWWACGYGAEARVWLDRALEAAPGETSLHASGWYAAGALACFAGDVTQAREHLARALDLAHAQDDRSRQAHTLIFLAVLMAFGGDPAAGAQHIERSIALFRAGSQTDSWGLGLALMSRRMFVIYQGDYRIAEAAAGEALALFARLGQPYGMALALNSLGDTARLQDDDETAARHYRRAIAFVRESGVVSDLPSMLHNQAYAELRCGELHNAAICLREALLLSRRAGQRGGIAECLTGCAGLATLAGEPLRAAAWLGAVDRLYDPEAGPNWPPERREYDRYCTVTRALAGDDAFVQARAAGCVRPVEVVVAEAIAWLQDWLLQVQAPLPERQ